MTYATPAEIARSQPAMRRWRPASGAQGLVLGSAIALLLLLVAYPLLWLVLAALGIPGTLTFDHLTRVATRAQSYDSLVNTLQLACGTGFYHPR